MELSPVVLSIPIYIFLIVLELVYVWVKRNTYYRISDAITNVSCGIGDQLIGTLAQVVVIGIYQYLFAQYAFFNQGRGIWSFVAAFVLVDFVYYWVHRLSHEVNFLWAGHVVHHQSEDYNLSVALRQSWFHKFFTFAFYLPLALIGVDPYMFVLANGLNLLYQFWIHTELIGKLGPLEHVLNTPSHHRVHHGRNEQYIDRNHAGVFIIWDKMFGTFEPEEEKPVYGITTPLSSWNPLWANINPWVTIGNEVKAMPTWMDKIKVIFMPPGWRPAQLGGQMPIPHVQAGVTPKFKTVAPKLLNVYVILQFVLLVGGTSVFLFFGKDLVDLEKYAAALLLFWGIVDMGGMLERKKWAYWSENTRWVLTYLYIVYKIHMLADFKLILITVSAFGLLSIIWLNLMAKSFTKK